MPEKKKMGRPTDSVKCYEVKARLNENTYKILKEYCEENKKNQAEGIRDGIHRLKDSQ